MTLAMSKKGPNILKIAKYFHESLFVQVHQSTNLIMQLLIV